MPLLVVPESKNALFPLNTPPGNTNCQTVPGQLAEDPALVHQPGLLHVVLWLQPRAAVPHADQNVVYSGVT